MAKNAEQIKIKQKATVLEARSDEKHSFEEFWN